MLRQQFAERIDRFFIPRELFVRADGRVTYVRVSRRQQLAAAAIVTGVAGWTLMGTAGIIAGAFIFSNQSAQLREADAAYAQLRGQIVASRQRLAEMSVALSGHQQFLLDLVNRRSDGAVPPAPPAVGVAVVPPTADPVQQVLLATDADLEVIASNNSALGQGLKTIEHHVAALDEARRRAAEARDRYAAALHATDDRLTQERDRAASLTGKVAALSAQVGALEQSGARATMARDYYADAWRGTGTELAAERSDTAALTDEVAALSEQIAALDEARERTAAARDYYADAWHGTGSRLAAEQERTASLTADVAALGAEIESAKLASVHQAMQRRMLEQRVTELSANLEAATAENHQLAQTIDGMQRTVALIADDRSALRAARDELSSQVAFLEGRMSSMQTRQQTIVQDLADRTRLTVAEIEKTVLMTGLDVDDLLASAAGKLAGEGGPFVPVARGVRSAEERLLLASIQKLDGEVDRWERLQQVLRTLPLAAPLDNYTFMSGFGVRVDPVNGKRALHAGVDLKNDVGTPVLATAPGTVVYAGWMRDYGRIVEIDHGLGIHTRYAHLKSIKVKVGQKVEYRQEIGKLGTSGRSTGPHLHYEVQVNGKPHDPMNFMEAGKYVFKG